MDKTDGGQSKRERDERSQVLIDQLSVAVRNAIDVITQDIEESKQFRRELQEQARENREHRETMERSQDRLQEWLQEQVRENKQLLQSFIEENQRRSDDLAKSLTATNDRLESQGFVQGEVAEDLFRRNLPSLLSDYGITADDVHPNAYVPGKRQYDLVAVNGSLVFVFEVKNKLRRADIKRFCNVQLPDFKQVFPIYRDHTVYGGIGALVVKDELQEQAEEQGLFVLTQVGCMGEQQAKLATSREHESAKLHAPKRPRVL